MPAGIVIERGDLVTSEYCEIRDGDGTNIPVIMLKVRHGPKQAGETAAVSVTVEAWTTQPNKGGDPDAPLCSRGTLLRMDRVTAYALAEQLMDFGGMDQG